MDQEVEEQEHVSKLGDSEEHVDQEPCCLEDSQEVENLHPHEENSNALHAVLNRARVVTELRLNDAQSEYHADQDWRKRVCPIPNFAQVVSDATLDHLGDLLRYEIDRPKNNQ